MVGEPLKGELKRLDTTLELEANTVVSTQKFLNKRVYCLREAGGCLGSLLKEIKDASPEMLCKSWSVFGNAHCLAMSPTEQRQMRQEAYTVYEVSL